MLQQRCLQALREYLRYANAAELQAVLQGQCPAVQLQRTPLELPLPALLRRDVLAMALCRLAILQEGEVYGGFVRDMLAGTHWRDVDLCFLHRHSIVRFKQTLPQYFELLLGLPAHTVQLQLRCKCENYPVVTHKHELIWEDVTVPVDISSRMHRPGLRLPATLGCSLAWSHVGLEWRPLDCDPSSPLIAVDTAVALLKRGQDVLRRPSFDEWHRIPEEHRKAVEAYYTTKKEELEERGYTFVAQHGLSLADFTGCG